MKPSQQGSHISDFTALSCFRLVCEKDGGQPVLMPIPRTFSGETSNAVPVLEHDATQEFILLVQQAQPRLAWKPELTYHR